MIADRQWHVKYCMGRISGATVMQWQLTPYMTVYINAKWQVIELRRLLACVLDDPLPTFPAATNYAPQSFQMLVQQDHTVLGGPPSSFKSPSNILLMVFHCGVVIGKGSIVKGWKSMGRCA